MKPLRYAGLGLLITMLGCGVHEPGKLETKTATLMKHRLTIGGRKERNPLPSDEESVQHGQKSFSGYCATCHGLDGHATGVPFASRMSPPVPDLGSSNVQSYSDGQLSGSSRMVSIPQACRPQREYSGMKRSGRWSSTFATCLQKATWESRLPTPASRANSSFLHSRAVFLA